MSSPLSHAAKKILEMGSNLIAKNAIENKITLENHWHFECRDKDGNLKWTEDVDNLVVTVGLNDSLDKHFKASGYTAAWYLGLTNSSPTFAAGDTMSSHGGWVENTTYSQAARVTLTFGSVSGGSVATSGAVFSINGTTTIGGGFMVTDNTKGGSSGILYGGAAFNEGNRSVVSGDSLTVTVTCTATAP